MQASDADRKQLQAQGWGIEQAAAWLTLSLSFTLVSSKNCLNNDEFQPTGHWVIGQEYPCQTAGVIRNPQEHLSGDSLEYSWPYLHIPLFFAHNNAKDKPWPGQELHWVFPAPGLIILTPRRLVTWHLHHCPRSLLQSDHDTMGTSSIVNSLMSSAILMIALKVFTDLLKQNHYVRAHALIKS